MKMSDQKQVAVVVCKEATLVDMMLGSGLNRCHRCSTPIRPDRETKRSIAKIAQEKQHRRAILICPSCETEKGVDAQAPS